MYMISSRTGTKFTDAAIETRDENARRHPLIPATAWNGSPMVRARADPLRDAVNEQVDDVVSAKVAAGERPLFLPQPLIDLGDCSAGETQRAVVVVKRVLDVVHAEAAGQHLHRKILQRFASSLQLRTDFRTGHLIAARDLRRLVFHRSFGSLHPSDSVAVTVVGPGIAAVLVLVKSKHIAVLRLEGFFDNQPGCLTLQFVAGIRCRQASFEELRKSLARAH